MSGAEMNPQMSQLTQLETRDNGVMSPAPSSMGGDENLVAGFGQLVHRVAHLEALVHGLLNGKTPTSEVVAAPTLSAEVQADSYSLMIDRAWREAPLPLRLRFVRDLLPAEHPLQPVLKEAVGLEELRDHELETWLTGYPSLFADAVERLEAQPACGDDIPELLAVSTLQEARQIFADTIKAMGIEWIQPSPGAMIGEEHEVIGEAESPVPAGRIATVRRRGFRQHDRLVLPAQVTRSRGNSAEGNRAAIWAEQEAGNRATVWAEAEETIPTAGSHRPAPNTEYPTPNTQHQPPASTPWPEWLRTFQQRSLGCELVTVKQLFARVREMAQVAVDYVAGARTETDLMAQLEPLLPLLGAQYMPGLLALPAGWGDIVTEMRDGLLVWLREALDIVVISPEPGARCDAATMQTSGVRRTAHAHEDGTVAKVERIGLRRGEHVLFRAQVLRYEIGGGYE